MTKQWDGKWWDSDEEDVTSPTQYGGGFCYWWEDMRPREVKVLVQKAYESGYAQGKSGSTSDDADCEEFIDKIISRGVMKDCDGDGYYQCKNCARYTGR